MPELYQAQKRFGSKLVADGISLRAPKDRVLCLCGPSGCGKTTLLRLLSGLLPLDSGRRTLEDGLRCSFLFQEDRLLPWASALKNLTAVGISQAAALKALERVGLAGEEDTFPASLSGGMRRRLAIARAAAFEADYFFLDEPLRGLDAATADTVLSLLKDALRGHGGLLVTHNPQEAARLADEVLLLSGPPIRLLERRAISSFASASALQDFFSAFAQQDRNATVHALPSES
ncbi:MAG TPA: ATP-binding cassette domain-containing protein [Candidatus Aphodomonas merdavium]|nr:ATP-binding cassette domain-containing protein [Candidatus Aphodomonas merdavium]